MHGSAASLKKPHAGPVHCLRRSLLAGGESRKMRRKYMWWLIAVVAVVLLGAALWASIVSNVEQPKYQLVESSFL